MAFKILSIFVLMVMLVLAHSATLVINGTVINVPTSVPDMTGSGFEALLALNHSRPVTIPKHREELGGQLPIGGEVIGKAGSFNLEDYLRENHHKLAMPGTFAPPTQAGTETLTQVPTTTTASDNSTMPLQ